MKCSQCERQLVQNPETQLWEDDYKGHTCPNGNWEGAGHAPEMCAICYKHCATDQHMLECQVADLAEIEARMTRLLAEQLNTGEEKWHTLYSRRLWRRTAIDTLRARIFSRDTPSIINIANVECQRCRRRLIFQEGRWMTNVGGSICQIDNSQQPPQYLDHQPVVVELPLVQKEP